MNGHDRVNEGIAQNEIIGWDLNNGQGFESYKAAMETWDMDNPPIGKVFRINGENFQVVRMFGKPVFDFWAG